MKKILIIILLLLLIGFAVFMVLSSKDTPRVDDVYFDSSDLPVGTVPSDQSQPYAGRITIATASGPIEINDVRALPTTREISTNRYALSESPEEEYFPKYNIVYAEESSSFSISLNKEPVSETRLQVEAYLKNILGISETQMCDLKIFMGVPNDVNPVLSGQNLGFSFCPGSVQLQ